MRQHEEKFEHFPEDLQLTEACDDAGLKRNAFQGQFLFIIPNVHLTGYFSKTHPRDDKRSEPKGFIRGNTRICPALEVEIAKQFDCHGIEINIDSMQKDRTQFWMVISGGVDKYVTEFSQENNESGRKNPPFRRLLTLENSTIILRHEGYLREDDGAIEWEKWLPVVHREHPEVQNWTKQMWIDHLEKGSNEKRFQYCLESSGNILNMRAIQGHSRGNNVDPSLQDNVEIQYNWMEYIYHVGSSHYCNSILQSGLIAGGKGSKERRHSSGSNERATQRRTSRRDKATNGTLSNEVECVPACSLLD